jgi:hypothetical protein
MTKADIGHGIIPFLTDIGSLLGRARQPAKRASLVLFWLRRALTFSHEIELELDRVSLYQKTDRFNADR